MIGGLAADRVDRETNPGFAGRGGDAMLQIRAVDQHNIAAHCLNFRDGTLASNDIHGSQPATFCELNEITTDGRICGVLHHPLARLECDEVREQQRRRGRIHGEHGELQWVADIGQRNQSRSISDEMRGPGARADREQHALSNRNGGHAIRDSDHASNAFVAADRGKRRQHAVLSRECEHIGRIDRRRFDFDQRLPGGERGQFELHTLDHVLRDGPARGILGFLHGMLQMRRVCGCERDTNAWRAPVNWLREIGGGARVNRSELHDRKATNTLGEFENSGITDTLALQREPDRRCHCHVSFAQLTRVAEHQLVRLSLFGGLILHDDTRAETRLVGRNLRDVDIGKFGDALRELTQSRLHELLTFEGRLVLAVLLEITELHRFPNFEWERDIQLVSELFDLTRHGGNQLIEHRRACCECGDGFASRELQSRKKTQAPGRCPAGRAMTPNMQPAMADASIALAAAIAATLRG